MRTEGRQNPRLKGGDPQDRIKSGSGDEGGWGVESYGRREENWVDFTRVGMFDRVVALYRS